MSNAQVAIAAITFAASVVNGALGYGFSSITIPLSLFFLTNRVLAPAIVPIEVILNIYVVIVNRDAIGTVWRAALPIVVGLVPGVLFGTSIVSHINAEWLKFWTLAILLPLTMLQAAGLRYPLPRHPIISLLVGGFVGTLYATTTISGPILALVLTNQGFAKNQFRANLGLIRLAESSFTAVTYYYAGLYGSPSISLMPFMIPSIVIGVPVGAAVIRRIHAETFRRSCMIFDTLVIGIGLILLLRNLGVIGSQVSLELFALIALFDARLLWRLIRSRTPRAAVQGSRAFVDRPLGRSEGIPAPMVAMTGDSRPIRR